MCIIKFYKATELTLVFKYVFIYFVENNFFPTIKLINALLFNYNWAGI